MTACKYHEIYPLRGSHRPEFAPALSFAVFDHFDDFLLSRALNALFSFASTNQVLPL